MRGGGVGRGGYCQIFHDNCFRFKFNLLIFDNLNNFNITISRQIRRSSVNLCNNLKDGTSTFQSQISVKSIITCQHHVNIMSTSSPAQLLTVRGDTCSLEILLSILSQVSFTSFSLRLLNQGMFPEDCASLFLFMSDLQILPQSL